MAASPAALEQENATLRAEVGRQATRISQLEELIRSFRHRQFGASSEQTPAEQARLFDEGSDEEDAPEQRVVVKAHARTRQGRRPLSKDLPRVDVIHDLSEAEKVCAEHGCALTPMGEDTSEQLEFEPAKLYVLRHIQKKYCCRQCEGQVVTAPKPPAPIPKSVATPSLLAWITVSKYQDALPLYRQAAIFERLGAPLDRTTLAKWMMAAGELIQPLINLLWEQARQAPLIHMDETVVQVLAEPGKTPQSKSYMWVTATGPPDAGIVLFHYAPTRSARVPMELLGDYHGAVMVDGYEAYDAVCQSQSIDRLGCWAHARRKFIEAQRAQPKGKVGKPDQALSWINRLYGIERAVRDASAEARYAARQAQAVPTLDKLRQWMQKHAPNTVPGTALGKALTYLSNQWPRLARYVEDGRYPIDNNRAENAIRPFVVGRKNWLFSQSTRGVKSSANLYSLISSAKAHGHDPHAYLRYVFEQIPAAETVEDFEALLPENFKRGD